MPISPGLGAGGNCPWTRARTSGRRSAGLGSWSNRSCCSDWQDELLCRQMILLCSPTAGTSVFWPVAGLSEDSRRCGGLAAGHDSPRRSFGAGNGQLRRLKSSIPGVSAAVMGMSLLAEYCWAAIHTYAVGCSWVCRAGPGGMKRMGDDAGWATGGLFAALAR